MNGAIRLDLLTRDQRERLERELARIPPALDGRARYGASDGTPVWQTDRPLQSDRPMPHRKAA